MQAAIGIVQLKKLKDILKKKLIKNNYILHLKAKTFEIFPKIKNALSVEWFVTITFKRQNIRDKFIKYMQNKKIECRPMIFLFLLLNILEMILIKKILLIPIIYP